MDKIDDSKLRASYEQFGSINSTWISDTKMYGFVTFSSKSSAIKAIKSLPWKSYEMGQFGSTLPQRIMSKIEWNGRTREYFKSLEDARVMRAGMKVEAIKSIEYQEGVIASISGLSTTTTSKRIKLMFEIVAPIAFVDHRDGSENVQIV